MSKYRQRAMAIYAAVACAIAVSASVALAPTLTCDVDLDGDVDRDDVRAIFFARGTVAGPGDPRDVDGDGIIAINDAVFCVLRCALPRCAIPPRVNITSPADGSVFTNSPIEVTGDASDNVVEVTVNGVLAALVNQTWTAAVPLEQESITITVVGKDASGNEATDSIEVTLADESIEVRVGSGDQPTLAVDSSGNIHIAWVDGRTGLDQIFYKMLSPEGVTRIDDTRLSDGQGFSKRPAIAVDRQGIVQLVWQDRRARVGLTEITEILQMTIDPVQDGQDGSPADPEAITIVPPHLISDDDGNFSNHPRVAVDSQGRTHVVWSDEDIGEIRYARLDSDGTVAVLTILGGGEAKFRMLPTIAIDSNDEIHLVWSDELPTRNDEIFYAMLDGGTGEILIEKTQLTADDGFRGRFPSAGVGPGNQVTVVFQDLRLQGTGGQAEIFMLRIDPSRDDQNGDAADPSQIILLEDTPITADDGIKSNHPTSVVDAEGNVHFTYYENWGPQDRRGDLFLQVVDPSGAPVDPRTALTEGRTAVTTNAFTLGFLTLDGPTTVVTWTDDSSSSPQVLLEIINPQPAQARNSPPTADAGPDQPVPVGATVTLDGTGSRDIDGDPLTFQWTLTVLPPGSTATLSDLAAEKPSFVADQPGMYVAQLVVNDGALDSDPDSVAITATFPAPTITEVNPSSGPVGTEVTITGTELNPVPGQTNVRFNGVPSTITDLTDTRLTTSVPLGATTGSVTVSTAGGTASASGHFIVLPTPNFTLSARPPAGTVVAGDQAGYQVTASGEGNFTGLIALSVGDLPDKVSATLSPTQIGPGGASTLTVRVDRNATEDVTIPITGTATINGESVAKSVTISLSIIDATTTGVTGRVLNTDGEPLEGVQITLLDEQNRLTNVTAATDAGGNFILTGTIPLGQQMFFVDGRQAGASATDPHTYPPVEAVLDIAPNRVTRVPHIIYLPPIDTEAVTVTPANNPEAVIATSDEIPDLEVEIPANTTIELTEPDGSSHPVTKITVTAVPVDKAPMPLPPGFDTPFLLTVQPGGAVPQNAEGGMIVRYPTWGRGIPGQQVDLFFFDFETEDWRVYGFGTVSADGTQVIPDIDPATGRPFVQPRFAWGGFNPRPPPPQANPNLVATATAPGGSTDGDPVDLATGFFTLEKNDMVLPGRLPIALTRTYRSSDTLAGPFGIGGRHPYDAFLVFPTPTARDQLILVLPNLTRFAFSRQTDGSFQNSTDPSMRGTVVTLDGSDRVLTFKDQTVWTFDTNGRLITQQDRNGNAVTIARDGQGRVTQLTEVSSGRSLDLTYDGTSLQVSSLTDPLGRTVTYAYNGNNRLTSVTDPAGGVTTYTYDAQNRILTITDPRGITFLTNEYDGQGRVCRQTQADGGVWLFYYVAADAAISGPAQQLLEEAAAGGPINTAPCTVLGTAPTVSTTVVADSRGQPTTRRFNSGGYLIAQTDALGQTTTFERVNGTNLLLSSTGPLGRVTRFTYDAGGNVTSITDPTDNVRTFKYDPIFNKVTSITDPLGNATRFAYDANGNLTSTTDPLGNVTQVAYNQFGQPVSTTDPLGNVTTFEYNAQGDLSAIIDPLGSTTTRRYDVVSRLTTQTDPRGKTTRFAYDELNRITQIIDALNGVTSFSYDENGNLLTVTDARESVTTHAYDSMDRLATRTDPLGREESYRYDFNGSLIEFTDRKQQISTFTYDPLNRRTRSAFADGTFTEFTYDAVGRLIRANDSDTGAIVEEYDVLDRLARETTPQGIIAYSYDALGRRTSMTVDGQPTVSYAYDSASRLRSITQPPLNPVTIEYDEAGRRTLLTLTNGVSTEYQYDASSRLTALVYRNVAGLLGDLIYEYDAAGNRIGVDGSFARTLLPDPVPSSTYDEANQQLAFGDKTMTYDANGNLETLTDPSGTTTFTWDARNRLTSLSGPIVFAGFQYDALGRRTQKKIGTSLTTYQYDGLDIIGEVIDGAKVSYLRSLAIDRPFMRIDNEDTHSYMADALGSIIALNDSAGGLITRYSYDPFGRSTVEGATIPNPFRYNGRENDEIAGLMFYRSRYYASGLHRFASQDRIGLVGGDINLYGYVWNNPVTLVDPTGEIGITGAFVGFVSGFTGGLLVARSSGVGLTTGLITAFAGGVAGAAVGAVNPFASHSVGAAVGAVAASAFGQVTTNVLLGQQPLSNFSAGAAVAAGVGIGLATRPIAAVGGTFRAGSGLLLQSRGAVTGVLVPRSGVIAAGAIEGLLQGNVAGASQLVANLIELQVRDLVPNPIGQRK